MQKSVKITIMGPLSKRKRLEMCLLCNKDPNAAFNGNFYRNLLLKYLIPSSKDTSQLNCRIFKFCTECEEVVQKLSKLKGELDTIFTKINKTIEFMKLTMIVQESSGDTDVDFFRDMALCDLRPKVRLNRSELDVEKNSAKILAPKIPKGVSNEVENALLNANLSLRVRMDKDNALMNTITKDVPKFDSPVPKNDDKIANVPIVTANEILEAILQETEIIRVPENVVEISGKELSTSAVATKTSEPTKLPVENEVAFQSEIVSINDVGNTELPLEEKSNSADTENKDYPFLEEIEQFDPWNEPSSPSNEAADPLDVQMENVPHSTQFNDYEEVQEPRMSSDAQIEGAGATEERESPILVKPTFTYNYLTVLAIKCSERNQLSITEIYDFIMDNFPYYRTAKPLWKHLIRKCLLNTQYFWKVSYNNEEGADGDRENNSVSGCWAVNENQCALIGNAIAILCQKNQHLMAFPERLDVFINALFNDCGQRKLPPLLPLVPGNVNKTLTSKVTNNGRRDIPSNSFINRTDNVTLHGMINELLDRGTVEESDLKINADLKLELTVPNVIETKPTIKMEDPNECVDYHSSSTSGSSSQLQIVNSFSCQIPEIQRNDRIEGGVAKNVPTYAVPAAIPISVISNGNGTSRLNLSPTFSPSQLAFLALANSPNSDNTLGTRQIIEFIAENFPYYRTEDSWKRSVYETLVTNRCYFKRNYEQGRVGPLISWSIEEMEPHYSQLKLQILSSLKESPTVNYLAAVSFEKLEETVKKALGNKYDLSFLKKPELNSQSLNQQPQPKVIKANEKVPHPRRGLNQVLENAEEESRRHQRGTIIVQPSPKKLLAPAKGNGATLEC